MSFHIKGLDPTLYAALWSADDATLKAANAVRMTADATPGFPDRITLEDASIGQELILLNHISQPANTPYRASHAVFISDGTRPTFDAVGTLPPAMRARPQSLRGFDVAGMMLDADLAEGNEVAEMIARMFENPDITEIHAHSARQGYFMARVTRAQFLTHPGV